MEWLQVHRTPLLDVIMATISLVSSGPANVLWAVLGSIALLRWRRRAEAAFLFFGAAFIWVCNVLVRV